MSSGSRGGARPAPRPFGCCAGDSPTSCSAPYAPTSRPALPAPRLAAQRRPYGRLDIGASPSSTAGVRDDPLHRHLPRPVRGRADLPCAAGRPVQLLRRQVPAAVGTGQQRRRARPQDPQGVERQLPGLRHPQALAPAAPRGRAGRPGPGRPADAHPWHRRRGPRQAPPHHHPRSGRGPGAGPGQPPVHRDAAEPALGERVHLRGHLVRDGVRRVRDRRLLPADRGLARGREQGTELVLDALEMAIWRRVGVLDGLVCHSDADSQYTSLRYTTRLAEIGAAPSIGTVGDSYDNSLAESTIGLFKTELIRRHGPWRTLEEVELAALGYIDWFNHHRLHGEIGNLPPAELEATYYRQPEP